MNPSTPVLYSVPPLRPSLWQTLPRMLYHMALSDFRERTRRYSFLVMVALTVYLGYSVNNGDFSLTLGQYRGVLNSAWVGAQMVLVLTFMLSLFGFYLVKNAVERDTRTGVGQIIATTPLPRWAYLLGKWLSHFVVLAVLVLILACAALVMQLLQHEAPVQPVVLLTPFLVIGLPCMALVAGLVVLFESISFLRGGAGNIIYFFLWITALPMLITSLDPDSVIIRESFDPWGMGVLIPSVQTSLVAQHPDYQGAFTLGAMPGKNDELVPFLWEGPVWNLSRIALQGIWVLAGAGLALLGSLFFERFDTSRHHPRPARPGKTNRVPAPGSQTAPDFILTEDSPARPRAAAGETRLTPLERRPAASGLAAALHSFPAVYLAELRLLLAGRPWWWYLVAAGLLIGAFASPLEAVRSWLLPLAWIWPVLVWSGLGCRERKYDTTQLIFSTPHPIASQLPAAWLAGATVAALTGLGGGLALAQAGGLVALAPWLAGALFIPALALALGVWTGSSRPFEIVYMIWWYLGPLQHAGLLDYLSAPAGVYLAITAVLLGAAALGRPAFGRSTLGRSALGRLRR